MPTWLLGTVDVVTCSSAMSCLNEHDVFEVANADSPTFKDAGSNIVKSTAYGAGIYTLAKVAEKFSEAQAKLEAQSQARNASETFSGDHGGTRSDAVVQRIVGGVIQTVPFH